MLLLGATGASHRAHASQFIVNGSFEDNVFNNTGRGFSVGLVGTDVTGWSIPVVMASIRGG
jgi:hypothetical protein